MSMATRTDTQSPALHVADSHDLIRVHGARDGADAVVRRGTDDQTDQESRSGGHGAATSLTVMDVTIHWSSSTPRGPVTCSDSSYRPYGQHAVMNPLQKPNLT